MKEQLLTYLYQIINSSTSIKLHIDKIAELRTQLEEALLLNDIEKMELNFAIKNKVQQEASDALDANSGNGVILIATGGGKSKIAINRINRDVNSNPNFTTINLYRRHLIVVPTQKLRDEGWKEEFTKWNSITNYITSVTTICYDSLHTLKGYHFHSINLDEVHNITEANIVFFESNTYDNLIAFTATKPRSPIKIELLKSLNLNPVYEITLDEAVKLGLVAPYDITVIELKLDNTDKCYKAGNAAKSWMQTELAKYNYASTRVATAPDLIKKKHATMDRMRIIYEAKSKTDAAKWVLQNIIPESARTLIFCGGISQAIELSPYRYFSKPSISKKDKVDTVAAKQVKIVAWKGNTDLKRFQAEEINQLACVTSLNEGENISNLDYGFMPQVDSNGLNLIQRMGRVIRFRADHIGKIIILSVVDTVDALWVNTALKSLSAVSIKRVSLEDLKSGKETISFN